MDLFHFGVPAWQLVVRSAVIYVALLAMLRIFGKREVGQFTLYDLVLVLLVANAVQPAMTGPDSSLGGGLVIIGALVGLNFVIARLDRYRLFHRLLVPQPTVIIRDGHYLEVVMRREGVDQEQCEMAIREHGMESVKDVQLAVLEPDGTISVVPTGSKTIRTRRRVRYVRH
ncbi:MAG: DUF421 domain-containing protein [Candidatus Dormibacteraceae bacterium]